MVTHLGRPLFWLTLLAAISPWATPAFADGPSFDCKLARTAIERTICADPELSTLDAEMAKTFTAMLDRSGTERIQHLADQRTWLKSLALLCPMPPGNSQAQPRTAVCLKLLYRYRVVALKAELQNLVTKEQTASSSSPLAATARKSRIIYHVDGEEKEQVCKPLLTHGNVEWMDHSERGDVFSVAIPPTFDQPQWHSVFAEGGLCS